jgi:hypothetical protein
MLHVHLTSLLVYAPTCRWIFYDVTTTSSLALANITRKQLPPIEARAEAAARGRARASTTPTAAAAAAMANTPARVRLVRESGLGSFWSSEVAGSTWKRMWGLLRDGGASFSMEYDFGEGGECTAATAHAHAVKAKQSAAHAAQRGAYRELAEHEDVPFMACRAGKRKACEADEADAEQWRRHSRSAMARGFDDDDDDDDEEDDDDLAAALAEELCGFCEAGPSSAAGSSAQACASPASDADLLPVA